MNRHGLSCRGEFTAKNVTLVSNTFTYRLKKDAEGHEPSK